jgi:ribosomal protein S18 acetylase RimI-like enzyme
MTAEPNRSANATKLTFRSAVAADAADILAFWARAAEDSGRPPDSTDAVLRLIARDPDALVLALDEDQIVGSIIAGWDGWRCHLYRLAVAPTHRRRGIARTLITQAESRFTDYGGTRADAMVLDTNTEAHPTWHNAGYTPQPTWSRWTKPL